MSDMTLVNLSYGFKERGDPESLVPLGSLYLVSALEEKGYTVDFRDYQLDTRGQQYKTQSLVSFLDSSARVIGISCCSDSLPLALVALKKLKEQDPGKYIILGGVGPTGVSHEILEHFPYIDMIVKGEGEQTIVDVMDRLRNSGTIRAGHEWRQVPGIDYRQGEMIYRNPPRKRIQNLDELPLPAYHKITPGNYTNLGLTSARGCPYQCVFCDAAPFWDYHVTRRDIENVIEEIKLFHVHYPGQTIQVYDETFTLDKQRVLRFCRRLKEEHLDIRWSVMTRIDLVDDELMAEMSGSGCHMVLYGIESGSDDVLQKMGKHYTAHEAKEKIRRSLSYFQVWAPLIWGFPFETTADFHKTMEFAADISKIGAVPLLYLLAPFPLSPLYRQYKDTLKFSRELYDDSHLIKDEEVIALINKHPALFPGFCYYEGGDVPRKYPIAKGYESIPFLP